MSAAPDLDLRPAASTRPSLGRRIAAALLVAVAAAALTHLTRAGAEPAEAALGPGEVEVTVTIEHSRFSMDRLRVRRGTLVRFVVDNRDPIHHELIVGPPEVHERHADGTEEAHPPVPGEVSLPPNAVGTTVYRFDEVGSVAFACHLPGHLDYGMRGVVHVVD